MVFAFLLFAIHPKVDFPVEYRKIVWTGVGQAFAPQHTQKSAQKVNSLSNLKRRKGFWLSNPRREVDLRF